MNDVTDNWDVSSSSDSYGNNPFTYDDSVQDADTFDSLSRMDSVVRVIYVVVGCVGFLSNFLVVLIILRSATMRNKVTNTYILNQSFIDGAAAIFIMCHGLVRHSGEGLSADSLADNALCIVWMGRALPWGMLMSSTFNLLALTVERYLEVVHPIAHKIYFTKTKARAVLIAVWMSGPAYNVALLIPSSEILDGVCRPFAVFPNPLTQKALGVLSVVLQYVIPIVTMSYSYGRMALVIHRRVKPSAGAAQSVSSRKMSRARKNIIKTLVIVCTCFTLCWTWNEVFIFLYLIGRPSDFSGAVYHFTVIAVFTNCCVNPFIYAAKYEEFQRSLRKTFCAGSNRRENV